ncbi:MAG: epoxyqueuosine reductase QueH [Candidatus Omnitrophica bacterium]|nr:epoxyqueuosine reductase QueH [Candidatus Omnitrophota bacterium]
MKVLLHTCCGPCMIHPVECLRGQRMEVTALFYNPNIHPPAEYKNRKEAVSTYARMLELEVLVPDYDPAQFFRAVCGREERLERCPVCWRRRLEETLRIGAEGGFEAFTTTLLASPYQDHDQLRRIGAELAQASRVKFHYEDFRLGFRAACEKAKAQGMYRQKYCGCLYSEMERYDKNYQPGKQREGPV